MIYNTKKNTTVKLKNMPWAIKCKQKLIISGKRREKHFTAKKAPHS